MTVDWKLKWGVGIFALLGAYGAGRMSAPESVKTVKEEELVHAKETDVKKDRDKIVTEKKTITTFPDGRKVEEVRARTRDRARTQRNSAELAQKSSETRQEIHAGAPKRNLSFLVLVPLKKSDLGFVDYGCSFSAQVLGPFTIGAWFVIPGPFIGASIGVQF